MSQVTPPLKLAAGLILAATVSAAFTLHAMSEESGWAPIIVTGSVDSADRVAPPPVVEPIDWSTLPALQPKVKGLTGGPLTTPPSRQFAETAPAQPGPASPAAAARPAAKEAAAPSAGALFNAPHPPARPNAQGTPATAHSATGALPADARPAHQYCHNIADSARDARFAWQKKKLVELEAELAKRIEALEAKTRDYQKWLARRDDFSRKAEENLVRIYTRMRPDAASAQLIAMDDETAAAVLSKLDPRKSSAILNEMDAKEAAQLSTVMAASANKLLPKKTLPKSVPADAAAPVNANPPAASPPPIDADEKKS